MTPQEKSTYLRIALALQGITVHPSVAEQIIETLDAINEKGGEFNVHDACKIEAKYNEKRKQEKDDN